MQGREPWMDYADADDPRWGLQRQIDEMSEAKPTPTLHERIADAISVTRSRQNESPAEPTLREKIVHAILSASDGVWREEAEEAADAVLRVIGFTQEDVDALRAEWASSWEGVKRPNAGDALLAIADRIAALLPPRA